MNVLERAKQAFADRKMQSMEMPEWTPPGEAVVQVWFKTPNPATIEKVDASTTGGVVEKAARLVALVAQNEDGSKMFVPLDYKELMIGTDPNALGRLYLAIVSAAKLDADTAEKN